MWQGLISTTPPNSPMKVRYRIGSFSSELYLPTIISIEVFVEMLEERRQLVDKSKVTIPVQAFKCRYLREARDMRKVPRTRIKSESGFCSNQ